MSLLSDLATGSSIGQQTLNDIGALFGLRNPADWDIVEGSYNGKLFHVFQTKSEFKAGVNQIQDSTGRRKAKYQLPYVDGQTTDDLGRKANSFNVDIIFFGKNYMKGFRDLQNELNKPTPGTLVHPVRGSFTCVPEDVEMTHRSDQRKAIMLRVNFIEHNFFTGSLFDQDKPSVKNALSTALDVFAKIDKVINKIEQVTLFARGVKNRIKSLLSIYKNNSAIVLTKMNVVFNNGSKSSIPSLLPVNEGGVRNADGTITSNNYSVAYSPSDPFAGIPVNVLDSNAIVAVVIQAIEVEINNLRDDCNTIINDLTNSGGSLDFYTEIRDLKQTCVDIQNTYEAGASSSNARVIDYVTPRIMSLREVAFENGIPVNRVQELDVLNPYLDSINYILKGQTIRVPVS